MYGKKRSRTDRLHDVALYDSRGVFKRHCVSLGHAAHTARTMQGATARVAATGERYWWDDRDGGWYKITDRDAPTLRAIQRGARRDREAKQRNALR